MAREVLEVVAGQDRGARFEMHGTSLVVGREADLDVVLTDPRVSRRHTRLWLEKEELLVEDLASTQRLDRTPADSWSMTVSASG